MTSDEILLAFRLIAMGRPAHDEVKRLAEFLAEKPQPVIVQSVDILPLPMDPTAEQVAEAVAAKPKRTKKAD